MPHKRNLSEPKPYFYSWEVCNAWEKDPKERAKKEKYDAFIERLAKTFPNHSTLVLEQPKLLPYTKK